MGSLFILRPGHERLPDLQPLPDGRFRLTVYLKFPAPHYVPPAYGTLYDDTLSGDEAVRYAGLRLIGFDPGNSRYKPSVPSLTLVYEQLSATAETQVGELTTVTDENDREVLQAQFIQYSSATYTKGVIGTTTPPGVTTAVLDSENCVDEGILRKITRRYVQAGNSFESVGEDEIDYEMNGLKRRVRNLIAKGGVAFSGTIGVTAHPTDTGLYLAGLSIRESAATTKVKATYLQPGIVKHSTRRMADGLTQTTVLSFYDVNAPTGEIVNQEKENYNGYPIWSTTTIQSVSTSKTIWTEFQYPGRAMVYVYEAVGLSWLDVLMSPPMTTRIRATVDISYQTSNQSGVLTYPLWSPNEWAVVNAYWTGWSNTPRSKIYGIPGYIAAPGYASGTVNGGVIGMSASCLGDRVYAYTNAVVAVTGGPDSPENQTLTLDERIEEAFTTTSGIIWYRKTVVWALIPQQPPVPPINTPQITVANATALAAHASVGLALGTRTNQFTVSWTPDGGVSVSQTVRGTLVAGVIGATSLPTHVRPADYNASTNARYWKLG